MSGISGVVRVILGLAVVLLATVALLVIFDVIPAEQLRTYSVKVVLAAAVITVAAAAIALLARGRRS